MAFMMQDHYKGDNSKNSIQAAPGSTVNVALLYLH